MILAEARASGGSGSTAAAICCASVIETAVIAGEPAGVGDPWASAAPSGAQRTINVESFTN